MADSLVLTVPDKRQHYGKEAGTGEYARGSITTIFDRFWAILQAHLYPEVLHHPQPKGDRADGSRVIGNPPQGKSKPYATGHSIRGPPGLRAAGDTPQRCQPHRRRTMKRLLTQNEKTLRSTPKGSTLGHNGSQARGLRAPTPTQLRGRRENPPTRHHGSTQQKRTPRVNHKNGNKQMTSDCWAGGDTAVLQERAGRRYSAADCTYLVAQLHGRHLQGSTGQTALLMGVLDSTGDQYLSQNSGRTRGDTTLGQRMDYKAKHTSGIG
ncbi:Hypothetical predicted protein [Pelobates cultripes]|uniref:Uncharacterized protein n=1 Tax=Pelobates cultripes TaxID=61616 RepID=A0AAD1WAG2_PELCU|nr:Hypothetical predicted protein [Pelobates cultripes]